MDLGIYNYTLLIRSDFLVLTYYLQAKVAEIFLIFCFKMASLEEI